MAIIKIIINTVDSTMPLITERRAVLDVYAEAAKRKWVIPCICTENLTTTEAVLAAVLDYGKQIGVPDLPITIAITNLYSHRSQSVNYTHTRNWEVGLRLFIEELKVLTGPWSPYKDLKVMLHLDHIQHDDDEELLRWDMTPFSSIMYDASTLSFDENIRATARFVAQHCDKIVIEGACDEIIDSGMGGNELTTPENALRFVKETGCDFIVANLGTEHRASAAELKYHGDLALKIKQKIGTRIVLHGASSVGSNQIKSLFMDGVCKVNIWTILERDSAPVLLENMLANSAKILGKEKTNEWIEKGWLGASVDSDASKSIAFYTTLYRQGILFDAMKAITTDFLKLWYV
jgi:fructose-bisphosphate aldolase class II